MNSEVLDKIKAGMIHEGGWFVQEPAFYILYFFCNALEPSTYLMKRVVFTAKCPYKS